MPINLLAILRGCTTVELKQTQTFVAQLLEERRQAFSKMDFEAQLLEALAEVNREKRCSGVIPLDEVRPRFPEISRELFDAKLLDMERRAVVGLREARTLRSRRARDGIQNERGLLFFVVVR